MSRKPLTAALTLMLGVLLVCLQGCDVKWVVVNQPPDPYANAHLIQRKITNQINQINADWQNGSLSQEMADVLKDNDLRVQWLDKQELNANNPPQDLDATQTYNLDMMLYDNANDINDAIARHGQWVQAFQGRWDSDYNAPSQPLNQCYLDYQIQRQEAQVNNYVQSGQLTDGQAREIRTRIQVVQNTQMTYYRQNGRLNLTNDQIEELRQMTDDNDRYLKFRTSHPQRTWDGDQYENWDQRSQEPQNTHPPAWRQKTNQPIPAPRGNYLPPRNSNQPSAGSNNQAPAQAPAQNPAPSQAPLQLNNPQAATPVPQPQSPVHQFGAGDRGRPGAGLNPRSQWPNQPDNNRPAQNPSVQPAAPIQPAAPAQPSAPVAQQPAQAAAPVQPAAPAQGMMPPSQAPAQNPAPSQAQPNPGQPNSWHRPTNGSPSQPVFVNADALRARSKAQDQTISGLIKSGSANHPPQALQSLRNAYKQTLNAFFSQNHVKKLTQGQVDQLSRKLDEIDKAIGDFGNSTSHQGTDDHSKDSQGNGTDQPGKDASRPNHPGGQDRNNNQ